MKLLVRIRHPKTNILGVTFSTVFALQSEDGLYRMPSFRSDDAGDGRHAVAGLEVFHARLAYSPTETNS